MSHRCILTVLTLTLLVAAPGLAFAQQTPPPPPAPSKATLAVLEFNFAGMTSEDGEDEIQEFETSLLTDKFVTALVKTRKFDIVERAKIKKIVEEQQFGESGLLDPERCVKYGQMLGADYFLLGSISVFSVTQDFMEIPQVDKFKRTLRAEIICDMRITDTRTSKIVSAERGEAIHEETSIVDERIRVDVPASLLDELQRELVEQLVVRTIDAVYPVKVISFNQGLCFLNRGEGGGIEAGDLYHVYLIGEPLIDPDTGAFLGRTETKIATIQVSEVLPKFSKAFVMGEILGLDTIPREAICRKAASAPAQPTPPPPRRGPNW